jgi:hypothetical protein
MNEVFIVLVGTVLGFLLSTVGTYFTENRHRRQQIEAVRAIIRFELEWNLQQLRTILTNLNPHNKPMEDPAQKRYLAETLANQIGLSFSRAMFESQLNLTSIAFSEKEIMPVFSMFDRFTQLERIQDTLHHYQEEERQAYSNYQVPTAGSPPRLRPAAPFSDHAGELWNEYITIAQTLLQNGNPLK